MTVVTPGRGSSGHPDARTTEAPRELPPPEVLPEDVPPPPEVTAEPSPTGPATTDAPDHRPGAPVGDRARPDPEDEARSAPVRVIVGPRPRRRLTFLRWLALAVLTIVLVGVGAWAGREVADRMPTKYAAHADVLYPLVQEQPTGFLRQDRNLSTQEVLMASRRVLDPVAAEFGIPVEDLAEELSTEVVDESEVIRVQFTDTSRAQARKILVSIVTNYIAVSNNPQRTELRAYLDAQIADVQSRLETARAAAAGLDLGLSQAAQAEIDALVQREATLRTQLDEDQLATIAGPVPQISVAPYVEHDAVSPRPLLAIGGGALAGLVVALFVVAVLARRMTRP
jgi:capsular polysaccharide biosynthesis protein